MAITLAAIAAMWAAASWVLMEQRRADAALMCILAAIVLCTAALVIGFD